MPDVTIPLSMPADLLRDLESVADEEDMTKREVICEALNEWIEEDEEHEGDVDLESTERVEVDSPNGNGLIKMVGVEKLDADESVPVTEKQLEVLEAVTEYIEANGYSPTYREIIERTSIDNPGMVYKRLEALESKGLLERRKGLKRNIVWAAKIEGGRVVSGEGENDI